MDYSHQGHAATAAPVSKLILSARRSGGGGSVSHRHCFTAHESDGLAVQIPEGCFYAVVNA
jgi:hypothetical protein